MTNNDVNGKIILMSIPETVGGQFLLPERGVVMGVIEVLTLGLLICAVIQIMQNSNKKK